MNRPVAFHWSLPLTLFFAASLFAEESGDPTEEFEQGKRIVATKCIECHSLQRVFNAHYTKAGWEDAIDRMNEQGLELSEPERSEVVGYLLASHHHPGKWAAIGQLHFAFVHFPIALSMAVGFLELLLIFQRQPPSIDATHWVLRLAAWSAIPAIFFGLCLMEDKETYPPTLALHRNLGLLSGGLLLTAWILRERLVRRPSDRVRIAYRSLLLLAIIFLGFTGHIGGALVHGEYVEQIQHAWSRPSS